MSNHSGKRGLGVMKVTAEVAKPIDCQFCPTTIKIGQKITEVVWWQPAGNALERHSFVACCNDCIAKAVSAIEALPFNR